MEHPASPNRKRVKNRHHQAVCNILCPFYLENVNLMSKREITTAPQIS